MTQSLIPQSYHFYTLNFLTFETPIFGTYIYLLQILIKLTQNTWNLINFALLAKGDNPEDESKEEISLDES